MHSYVGDMHEKKILNYSFVYILVTIGACLLFRIFFCASRLPGRGHLEGKAWEHCSHC